MGIRQRGESWEVNVAYKGARRFTTVATETEAKAKQEEIRAELILAHRKANAPAEAPPVVAPVIAPAITPPSWTLGVATDKAFEVQWKGTKSESFYRAKSDNLLKHFGKDKPLSEIDTAAVDAFRLSLKTVGNNKLKVGNSQATINHHLATLSMIFKIAHQRGGAPIKPVLGIKAATRARVRWLTASEEKVMLALAEQAGKQDIRDWFIVLIDGGYRPGESTQMTGQWCDFREGVVTVQGRADTGWVPKTINGFRSIPMTKRVKEVLDRRVLDYPKGSLFPYAWDVFSNWWDSARKAMDLDKDPDFVPYALRHTFATRLAQRGVHVEVIQKLMGHADIKQTMTYVKLGAKQYVEAISKLEPIQ